MKSKEELLNLSSRIIEFLIKEKVDIYGVEGAGKGLDTGKHASAMFNNTVGIMHGMKTYIMQDEKGEIKDAYSISAGLDYPGIGPEHAYLNSLKRVKYEELLKYQVLFRQLF